ncbi:MAG: methyltransferase domain-containing protein, partial [Campylobacterales bacterium]|nr:methyltransferase domain-containing protein [Campylobacterales bacterium]
LPQVSSTHFITLFFERLAFEESFHNSQDSTEKYGIESQFARVNKSHEFAFGYYYNEALKAINFETLKRVINLGINRGDEFGAIQEMLTPKQFEAIEFVGVDYSLSAIQYAQKQFKNYDNIHFIQEDINALEKQLGRFDLLITIATLQSVHSNFKTLFMSLVQNLLTQEASIIMGFPNSRWIDGELIYGAKVPHYKCSELSTLIKDIYFCKKYLQQHKYRVKIFGKEYIFLVATKI